MLQNAVLQRSTRPAPSAYRHPIVSTPMTLGADVSPAQIRAAQSSVVGSLISINNQVCTT